MPAGGAPGEGEGGFDWWAAPEERVVRQAVAVRAEAAQAVPAQAVGPTEAVEPAEEAEAAEVTEAAGGDEVAEAVEPVPSVETAPEPEPEAAPEPLRQESAAAVYRHVQAGEEFQEVRREYRGFVFPACAAFLVWYLLYIVAAVTLPGLMDQQVAGPFNVAWVLGLLQFASTFLITWLYARHARDRRDRLALGLRWETQDRLR
jgi:uncharacterized membrane protein (DUF485 family)